MSCPSSNSPGDLFKPDEEPIQMPMEYYLYTALMILTVVGIPFLYQQFWDTIFDINRFFRTPAHLRSAPPGCRRLGKSGDRDLSAEFKSQTATTSSTGKVRALFIYPIKSCYPVEVHESKVVSTGFEYDRQFCFAQWHTPLPQVREREGKEQQKDSSAYWDRIPHWHFVTQRQNPSLTFLKVEVWVPDPESKDYDAKSETAKSGGCLLVRFPFSPRPTSLSNILALLAAKLKSFNLSAKPTWTFQVPLNPNSEQIEAKGYTKDKLAIWRDEPGGIDVTSEIPPHILTHLQNLLLQDTKRLSPTQYARLRRNPPELRLFRVDDSQDRKSHKYAPTPDQPGHQANVRYQDSVRDIHISNTSHPLPRLLLSQQPPPFITST